MNTQMVEQDIDELEAGRELDSYVAEHLFGYVWVEYDNGDGMAMLFPPDRAGVWLEKERGKVVQRGHNRFSDWDSYVPKFSTTWEGAGLLLDHLHAQGWEVAMSMTQDVNECLIGKPGWKDEDGLYGRSASLFVAICRAALKAAQWQGYRAALQTLSDKLES